MPTKTPKQRKRNTNVHTEPPKEAETPATEDGKTEGVQLCDGEAVGVWDSLDPEEKREILDVTAAECNLYEEGTKAAEALQSMESMRAVRMQFVAAMQHKGVIQGDLKTGVAGEVLLLGIFQQHLASMCTRKVFLSKLYLFVNFLVWQLPYHWFFRLVGLCLVTLVAVRFPSVSTGILAVFEDTSDHRLQTRAYAFLSAVYVLSSAAWVSWYKIATVLVFLPLIIVEVERAVSSDTDQNALKFVSWGLLVLSELLALYFAWGSVFSFLFLFFFFFPGLGATAVCGVSLLLALVGKGVQFVQSLFQAFVTDKIAERMRLENTLLVSLPAALLVLIYNLWFGSTSRIVSWLLWLLCLLCLPPTWSELASQLFSLLAGVALTKMYIGIVLRSGVLLTAVMVAAAGFALWGAAKKLWTRARDRIKFGRSIDD